MTMINTVSGVRYVTFDGIVFETRKEALEHLEGLRN